MGTRTLGLRRSAAAEGHARIGLPAARAVAVGQSAFWVLAGLSLVLGVACVTTSIDHDEEYQVLSGLLARHLPPYAGFLYPQTPDYPLLLSVLFRVLPFGPFTDARLLSCVLAVATMLGLFALGRFALGWRATGSAGWALAPCLLFAASPTVQTSAGSARNDMLPAALLVLGVAALLRGRGTAGAAPAWAGSPVRAPGRVTALAWHGLAGAALCSAAATRTTYVFAPAVGLAYAALVPAGGARVTRMAALGAVAAGAALAALPTLILAAAAPRLFLFEVFRFHVVAQRFWFALNGKAGEFTRAWEAHVYIRRLLKGDGAALVGALLIGASLGAGLLRGGGTAGARIGRLAGVLLRTEAALLLIMLGACIAFALVPLPAIPAYLHAPIVCLFLAVPFAWAAVPPRGLAAGAASVLVLAGAVPGLVHVARQAPLLLAPSAWPISRVHATAERVMAAEQTMGVQGCIVTLSPLHVVDAGGRVPAAFSYGPFYYRAADAFPEAALPPTGEVRASGLRTWLDTHPPAGIFAGFENDWPVHLDDALTRYATTHGYRRAAGDFDGGALWLNPAATKASAPCAD